MNHVSFGELLAIQARVIIALVLRETRATFGASKFGYLWAILTPAISVSFLVFIFSLVGRQAPFGISLALFFASGMLPLHFFKKTSSTLISSFSVNKALLTYPLIKDLDTLIARAILISITYLLIMAIFYLGLMILGLASTPHHPEQIMFAFIVTSMLGFGFGTVNAVLATFWTSWKQIVGIITTPLLFLSGIFYIPSLLPPEAIAILKWNPVLHLVEWMRIGIYANYESTVLFKPYPLGLSLLLILLGLASERLFRKKRS